MADGKNASESLFLPSALSCLYSLNLFASIAYDLLLATTLR